MPIRMDCSNGEKIAKPQAFLKKTFDPTKSSVSYQALAVSRFWISRSLRVGGRCGYGSEEMSARRQSSLFAPEELPPNPTKWELADDADRLYAEVVFNRPLSTAFHYVVPEALRDLIGPGKRVEAPFGGGDRTTIGFCVGVTRTSPTSRILKPLTAVLDREPLIDAHLLELTQWIADRCLCGWGQVLSAIIPAGVKSRAGTREVTFFALSPAVTGTDLKLPPKQRAVLDALAKRGSAMRADELASLADCGVGPIHALRDRGVIVPERHRTAPELGDVAAIETPPELHLTHEQTDALDAVLAALREQRYESLLLHGVTGSGKTEVYIRAIEEVVSYGRQAIVLVPEISLTPQTIRRFRSRFPQVAVLHSHLTDAERHAQWRQIATGSVQVVVGARSAVFAPTPNLGLIVIDEEHETSFKQDSTPRYHAREVARRRAELLGIPLLLGSATPTLESWLRVQRGQDRLLSLPKRVAGRPLPPVTIVDIRDDPIVNQQRALGRALLTAMHAALKAGGQIILFLNIRGFAPLVLCRGCGQALKCPDCDLTLTWHQQHGKAVCHCCGHETDLPANCPNCHRPGFKYFGLGTERLEQELKSLFPNVPALRMDSDTMRGRGSHEAALDRFRHGDVRILLGTQMIAKGLDFPNVTLVGVVDADTSLRQPDLRARERTFQLIAQVAGRTGRGPRGGRVLVQTSCPDDPAIQFAAKHNYVDFATAELQEREACQAPPYQVATRIILRGKSESHVEADAETLSNLLRDTDPVRQKLVRVVGPAPCPILRLQGHFRYHLQLLSRDLAPMRTVWDAAASRYKPHKDVEFAVDVEPLSYR
jgi:primosomal protein N' (replication factor Y) (superfamily II helicase)